MIVGAIALFIKVGSTVVNLLVGLLPASMHDWIPFLKVVAWIFTFSFDVIVTVIICYIILGILSVIVGKK